MVVLPDNLSDVSLPVCFLRSRGFLESRGSSSRKTYGKIFEISSEDRNAAMMVTLLKGKTATSMTLLLADFFIFLQIVPKA
ncbi:hypothetical protein M5K25_023498 [Dendrobium thyrsiflorum]|uniref:Uncharacterized protein n=1 Tax=Dendrobium thyrsiflorum TaxID=117978 RepID=A0ABD0UF34_DENTH